ncbi:MAG: malic enzyme-like NAD(P)-binding protein [Acidimicrobiales bacterium]
MPTPNAAYSVRLRVEIDNHPGSLGRLTTAVGEAGGNFEAVDIVEMSGATIVRDITVLASDEAHAERIKAAVTSLSGATLLASEDRTFAMHARGKIEVVSKAVIADRDDLSMAYTPGVARVCLAIAEDPSLVHELTIKANSVAVVTDGSAVLGLGDIGPHAAMPVMEGKAMLFKEFAGIDAFPVCLDVASTDEIVETVVRIAPTFGGINLEDISAPRCFEVEERLRQVLDIPVFHDDQHGTAVVVLAALWNALEVVGKAMEDVSVLIAGVGAAGFAIARILTEAGVGNVIGVDRQGSLHPGRDGLSGAKAWFAEHTNHERRSGALADVLDGSDVFVGVSGPRLLTGREVKTMAASPVVFALANPDPEVSPEEVEGIAAVVATGRSDYPNQINNVLCFPGIFKGALDAGAREITEAMKLAAAHAIAEAVPSSMLSASYIVPSVFQRDVAAKVASEVARVAVEEGVIRKPSTGAVARRRGEM